MKDLKALQKDPSALPQDDTSIRFIGIQKVILTLFRFLFGYEEDKHE